MFRRFETLLNPTEPPTQPEPPAGLLAFFWHFARQAKWLFVALFVIESFVALFEAAIPWFIGRLVTLVTTTPRQSFLAETWPVLVGMGVVVLVARPGIVFIRYLVTNQAIAVPFTNLVRWQAHWHVVRQSWTFFQNDFAGRISSRVMQTGGSIRTMLVSSVTAVWYVLVYGTSAIVLTATADAWLTVPVLGWFAGYLALLVYFVPRMRDRSKLSSEARSALMGRIVDSYTNILTVKLFARARDEDNYVRDAVDRHTGLSLASQRLMTTFGSLLALLNAALIAGAGGLALWLWQRGSVEVGVIAMVLPLTNQLANMSRQIAVQIADIFEDIGVVQEGMMSIARPLQLVDHASAESLAVNEGKIAFEDLRFGYGRKSGTSVLDGFSLTVQPGERIGLVGRSGAGKSTVVNLLLRFFDLEGGRILIDGQDIARMTQESLRAQISVVTQDTSLLHRSIRDNIRYGRRSASEAEVVEAAKLAQADEFIHQLEDWRGNRGYEAQVGERGVKLSGGQRQRIAIARVILKNAPILVLDEATSALDSEVEAAIQASLDTLMAGKTVIAIAHRLSTIARMDRLVVLDRGQIVEQGSHAELLRADGHYAALWKRQSGGFIDAGPEEAVNAAAE
ncbi:MAG: ATP-binding cassette, subfamily multidrug efflux pump [Alphaproteobacteria bacterium]|jgi:ATP-binding cassette subfamily B multidrug efflux pump|nr:ATP-binding cassette, subfamily multidrug efflux pump [Alphaproteobacteria bacterium]